MPQNLPIDAVLADVTGHLRRTRNLVLIAPPGAGKTTRLPPRLVDNRVVDGRVVVLEPRRLAARLAARRVAAERGGRLGDEVGFRVRFENRTSPATRIVFVTEGILTRWLHRDPSLDGIGAVVLDEFHERSQHADLDLALLAEVQATVRPDLRIVVMSATMDPGPVVHFLEGCAVVESAGRTHPVTVRYLERPDDRTLEERVASGVRRAVRELPRNDVLAFLPGAREIHRTQGILTPVIGDRVDLVPLYGALSPAQQDRAVSPGPRRKVILSTNVAESSLTIEGIGAVVDGGYQRLNRFDPGRGLDRLELAPISRQSAAQRAGRAGRLGPGVAYRMWTEKADLTRPEADPPELMRIDLAPVLLEVLAWSATDPRTFGWFEAPPEAHVARALTLLRALGAVEPGSFRLTPRGRALTAYPLHPRLGVVFEEARRRGFARPGALLASLLAEGDIVARHRAATNPPKPSDVLDRLDRLEGFVADGRTRRAADAWGVDRNAAETVLRSADALASFDRAKPKAIPAPPDPANRREEALLRATLAGYADRVAQRRRPHEPHLKLAGGGAARLHPRSVVRNAALLVAVDVDGGPAGRTGGATVRWASEVERAWLEADTPHVRRLRNARFNEARSAAEAVVEVRYLELVLSTRPDPEPDPEVLARVLEAAAIEDLDRALPLTAEVEAFLARHAFVRSHVPELALEPLRPEDRAALVPELSVGCRSFTDLRAVDLASVWLGRLPPSVRAALERDAPTHLPIPSGRRARLVYAGTEPPRLSVRLQEVFGLYESPRVARGRVPVRMELLAPNMRPVQVTQDLANFWASTYAQVRKELRARYPKHQWPEHPREGIASTRVRPRR